MGLAAEPGGCHPSRPSQPGWVFSAPPAMLSPRQLAAFKADGAVLLPSFVGEAQLESWREQSWSALTAADGSVAVSEHDRATWPFGYPGNV